MVDWASFAPVVPHPHPQPCLASLGCHHFLTSSSLKFWVPSIDVRLMIALPHVCVTSAGLRHSLKKKQAKKKKKPDRHRPSRQTRRKAGSGDCVTSFGRDESDGRPVSRCLDCGGGGGGGALWGECSTIQSPPALLFFIFFF